MANEFALTDFTARVIGTYLTGYAPLQQNSFRGIDEFDMARRGGYASGDVVKIKLPGYPAVQMGLSISTTDITDETANYTISSDEDIYNVGYRADIRILNMHIVGGRRALTGDPNVNSRNPGQPSDEATYTIDNYAKPAAIRLAAAIEAKLAEKMRKAAFYSPIDTPAKLGAVNAFSSLSSLTAMQNELGWPGTRYGAMNNNDAKLVSDSLQNMFNMKINEPITDESTLLGNIKPGRLAGQKIDTCNVIENTEEAPQYAVAPNFTVSSISADGSQITFTGVDTVTSTLITAGSKIAIPSVHLFGQSTGKTLEQTLVVCAAQDAAGDGAGNVMVTLSVPLYAVGMQTNVASLPGTGAAAQLFPKHRNNYFYVNMGIVANPLPLAPIVGAENGSYMNYQNKVGVQTSIQGSNLDGINVFRMSVLMPTLAIPRYIMNLPSQL